MSCGATRWEGAAKSIKSITPHLLITKKSCQQDKKAEALASFGLLLLPKRLQAEHFLAAGDSADAGTHHFKDGSVAHRLQKGIKLITRTCNLNDVQRTGDIDNLPTEDINTTLNFCALSSRRLHLHQHQFTFNVRAFHQINKLYNVNQFIEVFGNLLDLMLIPPGSQGQAGQGCVFRWRYRQAFDVITTLGKQTDNTRQSARSVFH